MRKNPLLEQALLNAGVLESFQALQQALLIQDRNPDRCDVALHRWREEVRRRNLRGQMCLYVLTGWKMKDIAPLMAVPPDKVLKNLISCLEAYRAVQARLKKPVDDSTIFSLISSP